MSQFAILADDLTGAADSGAPFALAGLLTLVLVPGAPSLAAAPQQGDVLVVSTESRHLDQEQAMARVRVAAGRVREAVWVYKKIDSTLRGHPGPELAALMDSLGVEQALVAPAFPAQGRTTRGGRQLVNGVPLEETPFGGEGASSDLLAVFRRGTAAAEGWNRQVRLLGLSTVRLGVAAVCEVLKRPGPGVGVADAETDADLGIIAEAAVACRVRLLCGSAGLARALAQRFPLTRAAQIPELRPWPSGPVLVVAGSRHPRTLRQVEVARQHGVAVVHPAPALLAMDGEAVETSASKVAALLASGRDVILTTAGLSDSPMAGHAVAARLAQVVRALVADGRVGQLVLTGGDIAAAVCAALEASTIWLRGEVQPGVAWGVPVDGARPGLPIVTKAGGFGSDDALIAAINHEAVILSRAPR